MNLYFVLGFGDADSYDIDAALNMFMVCNFWLDFLGKLGSVFSF